MAVENPVEAIKTTWESLKGRSTDLAVKMAITRLGPQLPDRLEEILSRYINVDIPQESRQQIVDHLAEDGALLGASSHWSFFDGLPLAHLAADLMTLAESRGIPDKLTGFNLTIAKSMITGEQEATLPEIYELTKPYIERRGLHLIPYTREDDVKKFGAKQNPFELRALLKGVRNHMGVLVFPAGNMDAGRSDGHGAVNGLQQVTSSHLMNILDCLRNRQVAVLPIGIDNTHRIFSPDTKKPTAEGIFFMLTGYSSFDFNVRVGNLITDEIFRAKLGSNWHVDSLGINHVVMSEVGGLVSPELAGFYRPGN